MLVADTTPVLTPRGMRLTSHLKAGDTVWGNGEWQVIRDITSGSARFYDYDFGVCCFRAPATSLLWQPTGKVSPVTLQTFTPLLGPSGKTDGSEIAEWDGFFWAHGDWIDSINRPCLTSIDAGLNVLRPCDIPKLGKLFVHRNSNIPRESFEKKALIPSVYFYSEIPTLCAFLRGYLTAKMTSQGNVELESERQACTLQLALNAIGISTNRSKQWLRLIDSDQVKRVLDLMIETRKESQNNPLRMVVAKGELACFNCDVESIWISGGAVVVG